MNQGHGVGSDGLSAPDSIHPLIRFSFQADPFDRNSKRAGDSPPNGFLELSDFWALEDHDDVDVPNF